MTGAQAVPSYDGLSLSKWMTGRNKDRKTKQWLHGKKAE
jgi:hypothetical protein